MNESYAYWYTSSIMFIFIFHNSLRMDGIFIWCNAMNEACLCEFLNGRNAQYSVYCHSDLNFDSLRPNVSASVKMRNISSSQTSEMRPGTNQNPSVLTSGACFSCVSVPLHQGLLLQTPNKTLTSLLAFASLCAERTPALCVVAR